MNINITIVKKEMKSLLTKIINEENPPYMDKKDPEIRKILLKLVTNSTYRILKLLEENHDYSSLKLLQQNRTKILELLLNHVRSANNLFSGTSRPLPFPTGVSHYMIEKDLYSLKENNLILNIDTDRDIIERLGNIELSREYMIDEKIDKEDEHKIHSAYVAIDIAMALSNFMLYNYLLPSVNVTQLPLGANHSLEMSNIIKRAHEEYLNKTK